MKKLFFLTLIAVVCLYGFRGSGWRGDTSKDGDYTFNDDVYITDSLYAGRASIGGTLIKSNGSIVMANGDSTTWRNSTGADSDYVYDDGTNMVVKSDNANILLITGTDTVKIVNGAVKTAARNTTIVGFLWNDGSTVNTTANYYYYTNATDDTIRSCMISIPDLLTGNNVSIDSFILNVRSEGTEDSARVVLMSVLNGACSLVDSVCNVGHAATTWTAANCIPTAALNPVNNTDYRIVLRCESDGADDIWVDNYVKIVWHSD